MGRRAWLLLAIAMVTSLIVLTVAINVRNTPLTIMDVTDSDYLHSISSILSPHNDTYSKLSIKNVQYIQDTIAIVKTSTPSNEAVWFVFEYHDNTLYLTNYSTGQFKQSDFNDNSVAPYIISTQGLG